MNPNQDLHKANKTMLLERIQETDIMRFGQETKDLLSETGNADRRTIGIKWTSLKFASGQILLTES